MAGGEVGSSDGGVEVVVVGPVGAVVVVVVVGSSRRSDCGVHGPGVQPGSVSGA